MSMRDDHYLGGVLCHYGVIGMRWGVRRSPDQLGHGGGKPKVEKDEKSVRIKNGYYESDKGFYVPVGKIDDYCLNPERKHFHNFAEIGYTKDDREKLFRDLEREYDLSKKIDAFQLPSGFEKFSIPVNLGVTEIRTFRSVWETDGPDGANRLVTLYNDRKVRDDGKE